MRLSLKHGGGVNHKKKLDLVGKKLGRLFVITFAYMKNRRSYHWCLCDCGEYCIIRRDGLIFGTTQSCGCYNRDRVREVCKNRKGKKHPMYGKKHTEKAIKKMSESHIGIHAGENHPLYGKTGKSNPNYKHGMAGTKAYRTQHSMKYRATKKNQTPLDADLEKIAYIYQICETINQMSEERYEVDHIRPISKGGLHHQDNLQILKASLNNKKRAKITDEYKGITLKDLEKNIGADITDHETKLKTWWKIEI